MKILNRSKLNYKLREISNYSITIASAPTGFGKTKSFEQYFNKTKYDQITISLFNDSDEEHIWQTLMEKIQPKLKQTLASDLPQTPSALRLFFDTINVSLSKPLYIVLDDINFTNLPKITELFVMFSYFDDLQIHFILLTNNPMYQISQFSFSNKVLMLDCSYFIFSLEEIQNLLRLENI